MGLVAGHLGEDELYASLVARVATFNGADIEDLFPRRSQAAKNVAGLRDYGALADMFCDITDGRCGTTCQLVCHGTLFQYYSGGRPWNQGSTGAPWRRYLRTGSFLRLCPKCFSHDVAQYGVALWHRLHQLPLTHICLTHKQLLQEIHLPSGMRSPHPNDLKPLVDNRHSKQLAKLLTLAVCEQGVFLAFENAHRLAQYASQIGTDFDQRYRDVRFVDHLCANLRAQLATIAPMGLLANAISWPRLEFGIMSFLDGITGDPDPITMTLLAFWKAQSEKDRTQNQNLLSDLHDWA